MSVTIKTSGDVVTAILEGEIDHHAARDMRYRIDSAVERFDPATLMLDFGSVGFMDSSGIGLIMGRYRLMQESGGRIGICNVPPGIERMIKLAGLGRLNIIGLDSPAGGKKCRKAK